MREVPLSNCEKEFLLACINNKQRIDARAAFDYRDIQISFGSDYGCCQVTLGDTRVFAQVSATLGPPRPTRPKDGILHINVELSPMASPAFEAWKMSDDSVHLNRLLERCIKESLSIDLESLCVIAAEKVWTIRVSCTVLNHDGNILDCASIAAVTALSHFRINEVAVDHKIITIYSNEERRPIPLTVIHRPLCVTFAFYLNGKYLLLDPCEREERVCEGRVVVGMNKHREVCTLQVTGTMLAHQSQILRCVNMAAVKVKEISTAIERALVDDAKCRATGSVSFCHKTGDRTKSAVVPEKFDDVIVDENVNNANANNTDALEVDKNVVEIKSDTEMVDVIVNGNSADINVEMEAEQAITKKPVTLSKGDKDIIELSSGSEEEVVMLDSVDSVSQRNETARQATKSNIRPVGSEKMSKSKKKKIRNKIKKNSQQH